MHSNARHVTVGPIHRESSSHLIHSLTIDRSSFTIEDVNADSTQLLVAPLRMSSHSTAGLRPGENVVNTAANDPVQLQQHRAEESL